MEMSPFILVQFLKESIFVALIVITPASFPILSPLQTTEKNKTEQSKYEERFPHG